MATIADYIAQLEAAGIFNYYLPFFILFTVFYALLMKSGIFGDPEKRLTKKINLIIALGASAYVMIGTPVGPMSFTLGQYLSGLFTHTFVILMTILATMIIGYVLVVPLGLKVEEEKRKAAVKWVIACIVILGIGLFITSGGFTFFVTGWPGVPLVLPWVQLTIEEIGMMSVVALTGLVIYWLVRGPKITPEERRRIAAEEIEKARKAAEAARGG